MLNINLKSNKALMNYIKKLLIISIPATFFFFLSCDFLPLTTDEDVVATAFGENLYISDLQEIVPEEASHGDSVNMINNYVDNWIRQQIFLEHAKNNLSSEQMDFEKKIRNYKKSLIIYTFENQLLNEELDTVVANNQIKEYYENHKNEFTLKDHIVKLTYIKVPQNTPNINQIRRLYRSDAPEDIAELEEYCTQHAASYFIDSDSWMIFDEILKEIPINISNRERFLRNNQYIETSDDYYSYFLKINSYKLKENISPIKFVTDDIKNIILNRRKQEFIRQYRNELYRNAVKSNSYEKYI